MRIVTNRAVALLNRLMRNHRWIQIRLVAVAAGCPHRLFEQSGLHTGVGIVAIQTGRTGCLQVMRLCELLGVVTRRAKLISRLDQERLLRTAMGVVAGVARSIDNRRVDTRRLRQDFCGHILMTVLTQQRDSILQKSIAIGFVRRVALVALAHRGWRVRCRQCQFCADVVVAGGTTIPRGVGGSHLTWRDSFTGMTGVAHAFGDRRVNTITHQRWMSGEMRIVAAGTLHTGSVQSLAVMCFFRRVGVVAPAAEGVLLRHKQTGHGAHM